jgi:hypothetical protein
VRASGSHHRTGLANLELLGYRRGIQLFGHALLGPATGLGTPTTFTFAFTSPNGWQDVVWTEMEFNHPVLGGRVLHLGRQWGQPHPRNGPQRERRQ